MKEKILDLVEENWLWNTGQFKHEMIERLYANFTEKGLSWREMNDRELLKLMSKYRNRKDWVSVANIAFMVWENKWMAKIRKIEEVKQLMEKHTGKNG